ncbi:hypothetical protein BGX33_008586, partial [Mortierella sp. NVP41]
MPMQRFISNSSSSALESPLSPTYLSHVGQPYTTEKSGTANINIVHNNNNTTTAASTRRGGPINISTPPLSSPPSNAPRSIYDPPPTPTSPRLPQSTISSAAGVMKKLLRRRGHTSDDTSLGIGRGSRGVGHFSNGDTVVVGSPTLGLVHSFVIVGGQGAVAAGTTVYDVEPPSPVSPTNMNAPINMVSPPSSSPSRSSPGSMASSLGATGMLSPKSPTFPQSMMTRFTGRDQHPVHPQPQIHTETQTHMQMHMHQQSIPAGHVTFSFPASSPVLIPVRGCSRKPSIPDAHAAATAAATATAPASSSPPMPSIILSGQNQPLSLSAAHLRRRHDRRSLSADSLWVDKDQSSVHPMQSCPPPPPLPPITASSEQTAIVPDMPSQHQPPLHPSSTDRQGQIHGDVEFFKKSVEFLRTHHGRHNTADDWANRNKRKAQLPVRRQSESCLLDRVAGEDGDSTDDTKRKNRSGSLVPVNDNEEAEEWEGEEPRAFGPGSCWKDLDPTYQSTMDFDPMDDGDRSLMSSVDIQLVPTIASPTRFYDCPGSRKLVRTYMTSKGREFDEMIEFGFPLTSIADDSNNKDRSSISSTKDCRFLTLRLTLTPWHARADEAKLYGSDAVVETGIASAATGVPIKDMVNKFLSRTSAKLSCSPPRIFSLLPESRSSLSLVSDRKLSLTDASLSNAQQSSLNHGASFPPESILTPMAATMSPPLTFLPNASSSQSPPSVRSTKTINSNSLPPRRDKGFRIMDPSAMSSTSSLPCPTLQSLTTVSPAPLLRTVHSADYLSIDPSQPSPTMSSPPSTPPPTTAYSYQSRHLYAQQQQQQQHLLPPRKGSLSAMSTFYLQQQEQQQQALHSTGSCDDLTAQLSLSPPAVPPRRKASSPAIFNTPSTTTTTTTATAASSNVNICYQHLAPTPPPEIMIPPPRSRSASPFITTTATSASSNRSNKFSTSPPSPQPMSGITSTTTTTTAAVPIPIPGASNRYPHHRPPIYGCSNSSSASVNSPPSASVVVAVATTWSETDVYGVPSARITRPPRRHESSEQLHSQPQQQQQNSQPESSSPSTPSATTTTNAYR